MKNLKEKNLNLVFVYGTLMDGLHNNYILKNGGANLISKAMTQHSFVMFASSYNGIPFVADVPTDCDPSTPGITWLENATNINGEVWSCNDETLAMLDRLEGHPKWYKREEINTYTNAHHWAFREEIKAWCYLMPMTEKEMHDSINYPVIVRDGNFKNIRWDYIQHPNTPEE